DLPVIVATGRPLRTVTRDAVQALHEFNDPPVIFVRGAALARLRYDERRRPFIELLSQAALRGRLARVAEFMSQNERGMRPIPPPDDVVADGGALGGWGFPPLAGVVETRVLRPDGSVLTEPGYAPQTALLYPPAPDLVVPRIPAAPTRDDTDAALALLR